MNSGMPSIAGRQTDIGRLAACMALAAAAAVRLLAATQGNPVIAPDSFDFAAQSRLGIFTRAFWGSEHPPLFPLLWKIDPNAVTRLNPTQFGDIRPLVLLNAVVGVACWSFLAVVVANQFRRAPVRVAAFCGVLLLSLSPRVAGWDAALLNESVSLSFLALAVGLVVLYRNEQNWARACALAAALVALCLLRDTNVIIAVALAAVAAWRAPASRRVVVAGLLIGILGSLWGQHASDQRRIVPLRDSLFIALTQPGVPHWFKAQGMPFTSVRSSQLLLSERPAIRFESDPAAKPLRQWLSRHGRLTWYRFLVTHPHYSLRPVRTLDENLDGTTPSIAPYLETSPLLTYSAYLRGVPLVLLSILGVIGLAVRPRSLNAALAAALVGSAVVTALIVPDLDPFEVQRHLAGNQMSLRLAVLLGTFAALDEVPVRRMLDWATARLPWIGARSTSPVDVRSSASEAWTVFERASCSSR